ncbi:MAG: hypothetical protein GX754_09850 [Clostridiaceae bacterium]|nr:hypothetical protein [Clostridiaceae bacterium]
MISLFSYTLFVFLSNIEADFVKKLAGLANLAGLVDLGDLVDLAGLTDLADITG